MVKTALALTTLLLLSACTASLGPTPPLEKDLALFPHFFFTENMFDAVIILDENAPQMDRDSADLLIASFAEYDSSVNQEVLRYYPTYSSLRENHAIFVGSCSQEPQNRFANIYVDCLSIKDEQAIIRITQLNDRWILYVIGATPQRTRDAILVLADYQDYTLRGEDVEVVIENGEYRIGEPR